MKEVFTSETFQTLSDYIDAFMEDHDVYDYENVTIVIEKAKDNTPTGYHWKATLIPKDTRNALEDLLVEEHRIVRLFFSEEDITGRVEALFEYDLIPVTRLTRGQMESVKHVLANSDCEYGLNWDAIDGAITDLFDDDSDHRVPYTEEEERLSDLINERGKALNRGGEDLMWCMNELMENVAERIGQGEEELEAIDNAIMMMVVDPDEENDEDESDELRSVTSKFSPDFQ